MSERDSLQLYFAELVREYHRRADEFDARVCTGRTKHGVSVPRTSEERCQMNRHARKLRELLQARAVAEHQLTFNECDRYWHDAMVSDATSEVKPE